MLARVNDEPVAVRDVLGEFNRRHSGHSKFLGGDVELRRFLDIVIDDLLLVQEAYNLGIDADPEVVKYIEEYESSKIADYFVQKEIVEKAAVTDDDVKKIWETSVDVVLHARQIVVPTRQEAEEIRNAILHGGDFEQFARACSTADSRRRGGHVMVTWGTFEPEWERVVFATEPGELSPVIETSDGFELVLVSNRVDVKPPALDQVSSQIREALGKRRLDQRKKELLDLLWARYGVQAKGFDYSAGLMRVLFRNAPDTVLASWNGGSLRVREIFEGRELDVFVTMEPAQAQKEIANRIRQTVNSPLVIREGRERKYGETPEVQKEVDAYRDFVVESVLFRDHIFKKVAPAEAELETYFNAKQEQFAIAEKRRVAQILVPTEAEAKKLYDQIVAGADFAKLAKEFSRDMVSAGNGGDLGWIVSDNVPQAFRPVLTLKPGEVMTPVRTDSGWHIIKFFETKPKSIPPFAEVKERVREAVLDQQRREARKYWIEKLRKASKIEIDDAAIAEFVKANEFTGQAPPQHAMQ